MERVSYSRGLVFTQQITRRVKETTIPVVAREAPVLTRSGAAENNLKILEEILKTVKSDFPIRDIQVGIHWTAVISKYCGLASTLCEPPPHHNNHVRDVGRLHEKTASDLTRMVLSDRLLEASIGMAAINSLIEIDEQRCEPVNAFDILAEKGKNKNIGIIGHFPFIPKLKNEADQLWVFEKRLQDGDLPATEIKNLLPECDVVGFSATTLINHTFEKIVNICRTDAFKIMLGASTPMLPLLFDYGLDVLSGSKVIEAESTSISVRQGATFKQIRGIKMLSMRSKENKQ